MDLNKEVRDKERGKGERIEQGKVRETGRQREERVNGYWLVPAPAASPLAPNLPLPSLFLSKTSKLFAQNSRYFVRAGENRVQILKRED